ncbi:terminase [Corynebacterium hindlerae]|uniref:Terminase n=2 Tax=Corynebacterium hindlerae TaxID=699041 RepID=A0A7G5FIT8_9CORY|nr:terminase [Corynebacterium hindlerae]
MANMVATELDDNGKFRYHTVLISVPRQSGKTTGTMARGVHATITTPGGRLWYTAQTGQAARERWIKEAADPAESTMRGLCKIKRGAGDTRMQVPGIGSEFRPMPPTADYLHGEQSDQVFIDEPWAHTEAEGAALMQAIVPTMATRKGIGHGPQITFLSTKGTAASTWWHSMLDEAINDPKSGIAVIDYGISDDVDPTDIPAVIAAHPGVGSGLIDEQAVWEASEKLTPAEFARGYGNVATSSWSPLFTPAVIDAATTDTPLDDGPVHIGVAVSWDRSLAAIVAVGTIGPVPAVEVIAARPGTSWVPGMLRAIRNAQAPASITIDAHGPAAALAEELSTTMPHDITHAAADDLVIGTETLMTLITTDPPGVLIRRDDGLTTELGAAKLRSLGDRGRLISRKTSAGPIPRIEAAILGLRAAHTHRPKPEQPRIWSPA